MTPSKWSVQDLRALARDLPAPSVDPHAASMVRVRVLEEASRARRRAARKSASLWAGFAIAAAAVLVMAVRGRVVGDPVDARRFHGTVTALESARFVLESARPNEVVRLEAGTIHVEVTPLEPGERFVVRAGDGEVEVRGTAFEVGMLDGHLSTVHVDHGSVEVRRGDSKSVLLGAGDAWNRTAVVPSAAIASTETLGVAPAPVRESASAPAPAVLPVRRSPSPAAASSLTPPGPPSEEAQPNSVSATPAIPTYPGASTPPLPAPALPAPSAGGAGAPAVPGVSGREEERRERRDERRERNDQRRLR